VSNDRKFGQKTRRTLRFSRIKSTGGQATARTGEPSRTTRYVMSSRASERPSHDRERWRWRAPWWRTRWEREKKGEGTPWSHLWVLLF